MKSSSSFSLSVEERDVIVETAVSGLECDMDPSRSHAHGEGPAAVLRAWRGWRSKYVRNAMTPISGMRPGESRSSAEANRRIHDVEHDLVAKLLGIRAPKLAKEASK